MFVGVCRLTLYLPGNDSLKGKRRVVRSIIDRTRAKFHVAVAEVASNDALRQAVIGVAVVSNTTAHVSAMLSHIGSYVEWLGLAPVTGRETEVISFGDQLGDGRIALPEDEPLAEHAFDDEDPDDWAKEEPW